MQQPPARPFPPPATEAFDVVVVGGGPAGLSGALVLGRSRRRVLVVDDGQPRNAASGHLQGYLGHDGATPAELLATGRAEVERYGVEVRPARAVRLLTEVAPASGRALLDVGLDDGTTVRARRVLVTTGLRDELPDIPGVAERWGRDVLHCPYCHGWEIRDAPVAVVARAADEVGKAVTLARWTDDVVLVLDGLEPADLAAADRARLAAVGVRVQPGPVARLVVRDDVLVGLELADGTVLERAAVVVQPRVAARDALLVQVGAELAQGPFGEFVVTDPTGATGVPGVWAAGNVAEPQAQVVMAAAAGYRAALAIDHDLIDEDADHAVARLAAAADGRAGS